MVNQEGIRRTDQGLEFDWASYRPEDIIPLKPVHKQFKRKYLDMYVAYAFYSIKEYEAKNPNIPHNVAKEMIDDTRHELKSLSPSVVMDNVSRMVDTALDKFLSVHPLSSFTLVISPKSSAPLNNLVMGKIKALHKGGPPMIVPDAMVKNAIKNIKVDWDLVGSEGSEKTVAAVPQFHKSLMNNPEALYAVKKVPASYRRYFTNFLRWADGLNPFYISYAASQGRVLLVDDTVGEGATVLEMARQLKQYNPNEILVFSMFLDYGAGYDKLSTPTA